MTTTLRAIHPVLAAKDVLTSIQFFQDLGFKLIFQDTPTEPKYAALTRDNVELHIQWADPGQWTSPTDRPVYRFIVSNVDELYREFMDSGRVNSGTSQGSPWAVPGNTPWGTREFHLRDPGQNSLQFYCPV
jgi:hypothetical protein